MDRPAGQANEADFLISPTVTKKWAKGTGGPAGDEVQNLVAAPLSHGSNPLAASGPGAVGEVRTFNVTPEGGQGADLRDSETETSLALSSVNGQAHDRVTMAASRAGVRRLTPVECERLQGLPDGWTNPDGTAADSRRYAGLGDAVTANVAEWIGRRILEREASEAEEVA